MEVFFTFLIGITFFIIRQLSTDFPLTSLGDFWDSLQNGLAINALDLISVKTLIST